MEWDWFIELLQMRQDKIDTQGISIQSKGNTNSKRDIPPMPVKHRTIFTTEERIELKQIINEALDEREDRKLFHNRPNPKRPIDVERRKKFEAFCEDYFKELLE